MVAKAAIDYVSGGTPATVIADDTDVLMLLVHHFDENMSDISFSSEKASKTWSIRDVVQQIGPTLKRNILTSRPSAPVDFENFTGDVFLKIFTGISYFSPGYNAKDNFAEVLKF